MTFICDGCWIRDTGPHTCQREVLRDGADMSIRCECSVFNACGSWVPAEMTAKGVNVSGSLRYDKALRTHAWVPDSVEPWCDRCGLKVTKAYGTNCGNT